MLPGHWDCIQTQGFAEGKSIVAPGRMEPSLLWWGTGGIGTSSDGSCCQIIWESGRLRALGDVSELPGQAMALRDPCIMNEDLMGNPWRSQAGTRVSRSVLRDEMRQTPHLC